MQAKPWLIGWTSIVVIALGVIASCVYKVDPFFHYHKPDLDTYFYVLNNQRSQNDGISKHFDYDALITGTSMAENFKSSEMDEVFGVNSIKVSYSGGLYEEINDNLNVALKNNPNLKVVVRGLDMDRFCGQVDDLSYDEFPTYLYDNNPLNDVKYLFNKDVVFLRVYSMMKESHTDGFVAGITTFDDYSRWSNRWIFGINAVCPNGIKTKTPQATTHLTEDDKNAIYDNITQNVTLLADKYKEVDFYYFFTPYSAVWWEEQLSEGRLEQQIEAERYVIELILDHENIHLYSFNNRTDITTNINHYKDAIHYGEWINSLILKWMHDGAYLLTKDNYLDYLNKELTFYSEFDYESLNYQIDYEDDLYAATLLSEEFAEEAP